MRRDTFRAILHELHGSAHSASTLSDRFGIPEQPLANLLGTLAEQGVLVEVMPGLFTRTPTGHTEQGGPPPSFTGTAPNGWTGEDAPTIIVEANTPLRLAREAAPPRPVTPSPSVGFTPAPFPEVTSSRPANPTITPPDPSPMVRDPQPADEPRSAVAAGPSSRASSRQRRLLVLLAVGSSSAAFGVVLALCALWLVG